VTGSSGNSELDQSTCRNMERRARFDPKLDAQGNPTTGTWSNAVRWEIPE
jgi:protein TonB